MKKLVLVLGCLVALVATASPAQASQRHGKTCSIRNHHKCLKAGRTCRFRSHGKWHTYYFCKRHKPQVVVIHDTTTVVQQQSCGACQPSPCETCQQGDDSGHGDHGEHGHEGHGDHGNKGKEHGGDCD